MAAVLIREENKVQFPIYFVSKMLLDAEIRYSMIEKVAFVVIVAARKLRPYFDAHQVMVLIDIPLEKSLEKIERFGRLAKYQPK